MALAIAPGDAAAEQNLQALRDNAKKRGNTPGSLP